MVYIIYIIIKPCDKNLGIAVMQTEWYIKEAKKQLNDTTTYKALTEPPNIANIAMDLKMIMNSQTWLSPSQSRKLLKDLITDSTLDKVKLCRIYFLPKVHKTPTGMRPICASQNWITYWTSCYIHLTIFPLLKLMPSYITNSAELVTMLDKIQPPPFFQFLDADIDNLYPSIDIEEGLQALKYFLTVKARLDSTHIKLLAKLTKWVLTNNYLAFGDEIFLQISGTAMGTPCAVVFACIYVGAIEEEAFRIFASSCSLSCITLYKRFIDDLVAIVSDYNTACLLMRILNSRRKTIHFTFKIRNSETQFLDLTLYKTITKHNHGVEVKAYSKPMNKFLFLPPTSCHPPHIFNGWITGYGRRLRLNCSKDKDFQENLSAFKTRLLARG